MTMGSFPGALALCASLAMPLAAHAAVTQLKDLFVFGDSLSDGGNSRLVSQASSGAAFPPPPYYNGQYSNGPVAVEYLWKSFNPGNDTFKPSLGGGTNYAIGGATTGLESYNSVNPSVPDALKPAYSQLANAWQIQTFSNQAPTFDAATSLFVVWLFPNDVFYLDATGKLPGTAAGGGPAPGDVPGLVANGIQNIAGTISFLASQGAQNFLVPNMPDLGLVPGFLGTPQAPGLSLLTAGFNLGLSMALDQIEGAIPTLDIVQFDTAALFTSLAANPGAYGFDVANAACVDNLLNGQCTPENWDKWVFWDGVHPTTRAHELLARQFRAAVVPEPPTYMLLSLGLLALGWSTGRRKTAA
jgi:phospholipase/lecithinase/hemolysin